MKLYLMVAAVVTALPASAQFRTGFYERPPTPEQLAAPSKAKKPELHQKPRLPLPVRIHPDADHVLDTRPFMGVEQPKKKEPENLLLNWKAPK